jgi:hypothetical protein
MSGARLLGLCAVALALAACTRVFDAVTPNGTEMACTPQSTDPACAPSAWPIGIHTANSDPWLVAHNQVITSMNPAVLVLNFDNGASSDDTLSAAKTLRDALATGSTYHDYQGGDATLFMTYQILPIVDLTNNNPSNPPAPSGWSNPSSSLLPTTSTGEFDPTQLFSPGFADFGFTDPSSSPPRPLSLCELFEKGIVNEVWIQDGESDVAGGPQRRAPLYLERKQEYYENDSKIAGEFDQCVGGGTTVSCLSNITCGVTVRIAHLDPLVSLGGAGVGCDLEIRGWGIEGMWADVPALEPDAAAFLNQDFDTRFGVNFNGWPEICDPKSAAAGVTCVTYTTTTADGSTQTSASGVYSDSTPWTIDPFLQGCGSSQFPPNATLRGDFENTTSRVESRCEHFGLRDALGGGDTYQIYPASTVVMQDPTYTGCGGGWQIYWRQSMPGYQNQATASDGTPMKNWWPVLFY